MPDMSLQRPAQRPRGRPWQKGESGNPGGRRRGSRNKATLAAEVLFDGEAEALARKAVELALAGNPLALRLCLERVVAPRRVRAVPVPLPPIASPADIAPAMGAVAAALSRGAITTSQAAEVAQMVEVFIRAIDTSDFDRRLSQLERSGAQRPR